MAGTNAFLTAVAAMAIGSLVIMLQRLGLVFTGNKHTTFGCLSNHRTEVHSRRHHQDRFSRRGVTHRLETAEPQSLELRQSLSNSN